MQMRGVMSSSAVLAMWTCLWTIPDKDCPRGLPAFRWKRAVMLWIQTSWEQARRGRQEWAGGRLGQSNRHGIKMTVPLLLLKNTSSKISSLPLAPLLQRTTSPITCSATAPCLSAYSGSDQSVFASYWAATMLTNANGDLPGSSSSVSPHY